MASLSTLFREKYDRLVLGLGAVVLLGSLAFIVLGIIGRDEAAGDPVSSGRTVAEADLTPVRDALAKMNEPVLLTATNSVLVSEPRISCIKAECRKLIRIAEDTCPFCGTKQPKITDDFDTDGDTMWDKYELSNGLDRIVKDGEFDLDGDGFTNLEEFTAKTAANDPSSHPSMFGKLRMSGVHKRPLNYRLRGLSKSGTVYTFQVNLETLDETLFVKLGQTVKGYHIKSFNSPKETLTIERDGKVIDMPNGKKVEVPRSVAQIVNIIRDRYVTNVTAGAKIDVDGIAVTIKEILDEEIAATRAPIAAIDGTNIAGVVQFIIPRETEAERAIRKGGGKLPAAPERVPESFPQEPRTPPASNLPPGGFERPFTPAPPVAPTEGFGPPPAEVLQRMREANRVRPQ